MPRFFSFHDFSLTEMQSPDLSLSIEQIRRAILDNGEELKDVFFVGKIKETAVFLNYSIKNDTATAEVDGEASQIATDYVIDWDKKDLYKFFKNYAPEISEETPSEGPNFSISDILEVSSELLQDQKIYNYIAEIDTSDVFVDIMAKESQGNVVTFQGYISDDSIARIESFNSEKFSSELISSLISGLTRFES